MRIEQIKAIPRRDLIRKLRALGFESPRRAGAHLFMRRGGMYIRVPGPEDPQVSVELQRALLRQLEIDMPVWEMA